MVSRLITENYVAKVDEELIISGIPLHARSMRVVRQWMHDNQIFGDFTDPQYIDPVNEIYRRLYPDGDFSLPSMLEGGVAFRDQIYPVKVQIAYGKVSISPTKYIEISKDALAQIWSKHPAQFWQAHYVVADLWDFAYGASDVRGDTEVDALLSNAQSHITAVARMIQSTDAIASVVQSACLAAELSMKGALAHFGMKENERRRFSHHLPKIAGALTQRNPNSNDTKLLEAVETFPNYVDSRYAQKKFSKIELSNLMHSSQFVSAEAVRRISDRNLAGAIEADTTITERLRW